MTELSPYDALDWIGLDHRKFYFELGTTGQRIGQLWMNKLNMSDYNKLSGSLVDPFHADNWAAVLRALEYLLER